MAKKKAAKKKPKSMDELTKNHDQLMKDMKSRGVPTDGGTKQDFEEALRKVAGASQKGRRPGGASKKKA